MAYQKTLGRDVRPWDDYFLGLARLVAGRSKDPHTQHGCVLVDGRRQVVSTGYNGPPPGVDDGALDWTRPGKYLFSIHSEQNAVARAGRILDGCTASVPGLPGPDCCRLLLAAGVCRVVHGDTPSRCVPADAAESVRRLCEFAGVRLERLKVDADGT